MNTRLFQTTVPATGGDPYAAGVWLRGTGTDIGKDVFFSVARVGAGPFVSGSVTATLTADWVFHDTRLTLDAANSGLRILFPGLANNAAASFDIAGAQLYADRLAVDAQCVVSRAADDVSLTDLSPFAGPELTLSISGITAKDTEPAKTQYLFAAQGASALHRIVLFRSVASGNLVALINAGNGQRTMTLGNLGPDTPFRASLSIKDGEIVASLNGAAVVINTDLDGFPVLTQAQLGGRNPVASYDAWGGTISDVLVWRDVLPAPVLRDLFLELD